MRIIAGKAGGRRIRAPSTSGTRPVTDRAREAVFSSIGGGVVDADVLDLYAGSGSFGLEALSRGARSSVFVENAHKALAALRANIETVGLGGTVFAGTVEEFLRRGEGVFHLAFVDPPWPRTSELVERDLSGLDHLLHPGAVVILSRRHGDATPGIPKTWRVAADKRYGDTRILRYRKAEPEDDVEK